MTINKKILFKNPSIHSLIITKLELITSKVISTDYKYIKLHRNFNKSFLILPNTLADLGNIIIIAIPNTNKNNKPIKTNHKLDAFIRLTIYEPLSDTFDDITNINNINHIKLINKKQNNLFKILNTSINGWILLGNLNYSFQQSLFYPKQYFNNSKQIQHIPMIRYMTMQNNFLIPLKLESLCIYNCDINTENKHFSQLDFQILEFYKNKYIIDGQNDTICKIKYYPISNKTHYETQLILNTNITSFQIPITVYNGQLNIIYANMTNDINRKIQINNKKNWFNSSANIVKNMSCINNHTLFK